MCESKSLHLKKKKNKKRHLPFQGNTTYCKHSQNKDIFEIFQNLGQRNSLTQFLSVLSKFLNNLFDNDDTKRTGNNRDKPCTSCLTSLGSAEFRAATSKSRPFLIWELPQGTPAGEAQDY